MFRVESARAFGVAAVVLLILIFTAVVWGCSYPTEVWLPCDVASPPDYCAQATGVPAK